MTFSLIMPSKYRCPACKSEDIIEHDEYIECQVCHLEFFKEFLGSKIDEENLLSKQDLNAFAGAFHDELKDPEKQKKLIKTLKEDTH